MPNRYDSEKSRENNLAGAILIVMMSAIVGFMIYSIFFYKGKETRNRLSTETNYSIYSTDSIALFESSSPAFSETVKPLPEISGTLNTSPGNQSPTKASGSPVGETISPAISASPGSATETPSPTSTFQWPSAQTTPVQVAASPPDGLEWDETPTLIPSSSPSVSPSKQPSPEPSGKKSPKPTPHPTPKSTPKPAAPKEPMFEPPRPDGPPDMERAYDLFKDKKGKAEFIVTSKAFPVRSYLIDVTENKYYDIKFQSIGKDKYKTEIPPGKYIIKFVKDGYFTFQQEFEIGDGDVANVPEVMEKRPYIEINSNPPGARILIDGAFAGVTPKIIKGLDEKEYTITLKKDGFQSSSFKVKLKRNKGEKKSVTLEKR